jgi:penicillin-binding protein 1A
MQRYKMTVPRLVLAVVLLGAGGGTLACLGALQYLRPDFPDVATLRDVDLQVPLRIYSRDGLLIAQFGEQRRIPLKLEQIPQHLIDAILAAEDDRFFEHNGVDYQGLVRAIGRNVMSGDMGEGGSTITMQLTRGIFLTPEKTYRRKLVEIFLTLRIEQLFSKQEILALYLNRIFLGQRAYGVGAAAEVYFGKTMDQLSLAEMALIAGLPQRPSRDNPVANPEYARQRRSYVLRRLLEKGTITQAEHDIAALTPVQSQLHGPSVAMDAPFVAEMVRTDLLARMGPAIYTAGYKVVTTVDSRLQAAAVRALRLALLEYDLRHGYRGPVGHVELPPASGEPEWAAAVSAYSDRGTLIPAIVTGMEPRSVKVFARKQGGISIPWSGLEWARPATADGGVGKAPESAGKILSVGDIVYVAQEVAGPWRLMQVPDAEGAFVAIDPQDGAVAALTGGFDYYASNYNRAVQAKRQPGSSFKPFLYSAALEKGFTAATLINDAPLVFNDASLEATWRPQNSSREFYGPTRMREALVRSRNLVSIRILNDIGPAYATDYIQHFGFAADELPQNLTLALGTALVSPLEMASAYAVFANGGYRVAPYFIERVEDASGKVVFTAEPKIACPDCDDGPPSGVIDTATATVRVAAPPSSDVDALPAPVAGTSVTSGTRPESRAPQAISPQNAYLMTDMMSDVVRRGTATRARALQRDDIAGKTGTTNDRRDAWFLGFNADLVGAAWVGFDQERSLGPREEGARTALPMWIYFMAEALKGTPPHRLAMPPGLVTMRISTETGRPAGPGESGTVFETFLAGHTPADDSSGNDEGLDGSTREGSDGKPLF